MLGGTDIGCLYWGECEAVDGMHFLSPDLMVAELIDPVTGSRVDPVAGAEGELVYTALRRQASPLLRFRDPRPASRPSPGPTARAGARASSCAAWAGPTTC